MLKSNSPLPLPPSPWNYRVPHSDLTIQFREFGPYLSDVDTTYCLLDAANIAIMHWGQPEPIGPTVLNTMFGDVHLQLASGSALTWYQWGTAIRGITDFVIRYGAVNMAFIIVNDRYSIIAEGLLSLEE